MAHITLIVVPYWWNGCPESLAATIQAQRPDLFLATLPHGSHHDHHLHHCLSHHNHHHLHPHNNHQHLHQHDWGSYSTSGTGAAVTIADDSDTTHKDAHSILQSEEESPISLNPPHNNGELFPFSETLIPLVGQLTLPSFASSSLFCPITWWASEKYDGLRACWNSKKLYSRNGTELILPMTSISNHPPFVNPSPSHASSLIKHFPERCLDGELWFGRGEFNTIQKLSQLTNLLSTPTSSNPTLKVSPMSTSIIYQQNYRDGVQNCIKWCDMRFLVFDCPALHFQHLPYEDRYKILLQPFLCKDQASLSLILEPVANRLINSKSQIQTFTSQVLHTGGEGTVVRQPNVPYGQGRSNNIVKFKMQRDAEGLIVSRTDNDGEFVVKVAHAPPFIAATLPSNPISLLPHPYYNDTTAFATMPPSNKQGRVSPQVGDVVTFTFSGYSNNHPTNAKIVRVRHDMNWLDTYGDVPYLRNVNETSQKGMRQPIQRKEYGYWTANECENIRKFFGAFAAAKGKSPYDPQSWYDVSRHQIYATKGGNTIMTIYKHSLKRALMDMYPNIGLIESKFPKAWFHKKHWHIFSNRKKVIESIALRLSFDPRIPANWYRVSIEAFYSDPSVRSMMKNYYGDDRIFALMDIYPDIGLDTTKFNHMKTNHWKYFANRRKFFDEFAVQKSFDPLLPSNWYSVLPNSILQKKGGGSVLYYYDGSLSVALADLYPDIGLNHNQFQFLLNRKLRPFSKTARRKFFDTLALSCGFEPLVAANWYNVDPSVIRKAKDGASILKYYRGSITRALQDLYPDIGLVESKFHKVTNKFWQGEDNAKKFFDKYADEKAFDPLVAKNWCHVSTQQILAVKGGSAIMKYYNGSIYKALNTVYHSKQFDHLI
eukprot:Phypoly_transcript_01578.p1 GENE.Phypoly_transcript_01578~~Phypoly_transcript_01578.p1  ORF type:complete len:1027 (+),score=73.79 Phypoly_transcript_01578:436-3081(+)